MRTHAPASHPAQAAAPRRGRRPSLASSAALAPPPAPATAGGRAGGALSMARDLRASMADDPTLSAYMAGLRGSGQSTADFASSTTRMEVVEAEGAAGDELPLSYDPAAIARFWSKRPKAVVQRILQLLGISGGFLGRLAWDAYRGQLAETEVARAIELREIVTSLGPAYIKLGQALSIRPDLLSPAAMRELQKLCDKVPSFPNATAMALIEKELGAPWTAFYATLGPDPVAAASLGQVYQGTLLSTGETVAVKVQRPYVLETVTVDLYVIRSVFAFLRRFEVPTDLVGLLDEWAARFFEELDYVREGENATRFGGAKKETRAATHTAVVSVVGRRRLTPAPPAFPAMMAADLPQVVVPRTCACGPRGRAAHSPPLLAQPRLTDWLTPPPSPPRAIPRAQTPRTPAAGCSPRRGWRARSCPSPRRRTSGSSSASASSAT